MSKQLDDILIALNWRKTIGNHEVDDETIHLVLEGGGQRAAYTTGVMMALRASGLLEYADGMVGTSGGALNAAYFAAAQEETGADILINNLSEGENSEYFGGDMPYDEVIPNVFANRVFGGDTPLDTAAIAVSQPPVYVVATEVGYGTAEVFSGDNQNFAAALRASANVQHPKNGGAQATQIGWKYYVDGGFAAGIPLEQSQQLGSTKQLIIGTATEPPQPSPVRGLMKAANYLAFLGRFGKPFADADRRNSNLQNEQKKKLFQGKVVDAGLIAPKHLFTDTIEGSSDDVRAAMHHGFDMIEAKLLALEIISEPLPRPTVLNEREQYAEWLNPYTSAQHIECLTNLEMQF